MLYGIIVIVLGCAGTCLSLVFVFWGLHTKEALLLKAGISIAVLAWSPIPAFFLVVFIPGMADEKFISAADGSFGPAFDAWIVLIGLVNLIANILIWYPWKRRR